MDTTVTRTPWRLHSLHKRAKVAVAGKQRYLVKLSGKFHCTHREFDAHVLCLNLRRPSPSSNSLARLVTTVKPL